jgi:hypothetical protein
MVLQIMVLRIMAAAIVDFKIRLIGALHLSFVFELPELLPDAGHDLGQRALLAGEHQIAARRNSLYYHALWRRRSFFHHRADHIAVFAATVAGVIGVKRINMGSRLAWNFPQNPFLKKLLPLRRNDSASTTFSRVGGTSLDSDD